MIPNTVSHIVSDHQGNGDDEVADHHEMDVKSKDQDEDDSA